MESWREQPPGHHARAPSGKGHRIARSQPMAAKRKTDAAFPPGDWHGGRPEDHFHLEQQDEPVSPQPWPPSAETTRDNPQDDWVDPRRFLSASAVIPLKQEIVHAGGRRRSIGWGSPRHSNGRDEKCRIVESLQVSLIPATQRHPYGATEHPRA